MRSLLLAILPWLLFASEPLARAQGERPVVVDYVAPLAQCASAEAFQALITQEIARSPIRERSWHYSVSIRREQGEFDGALTTENHVRTVHGAVCDDVTEQLASIIARGDPPQVEPSAVPPSSDTRPPRPAGAIEGRLGARVQGWTHGYQSAPSFGGMGVLSIELPWGLRKTMLEIAAGAMYSSASDAHLTYYVVDTQVCPFDVAFGQTGVSVLGCLRMAGSAFETADSFGHNWGGALWFGGGGRLRWQSGSPFFVELHVNGVYGTVSSGESTRPAWLDAGGTVGIRL